MLQVGIRTLAQMMQVPFILMVINDCPLFYDIYMRPGAIYWYDKTGQNKINGTTESNVGWDFNYFTFDFYPMGSWGTSGGMDACFVRCVEK